MVQLGLLDLLIQLFLRPLGGVLVASGATGGLIPEIIDMGVPVINR